MPLLEIGSTALRPTLEHVGAIHKSWDTLKRDIIGTVTGPTRKFTVHRGMPASLRAQSWLNATPHTREVLHNDRKQGWHHVRPLFGRARKCRVKKGYSTTVLHRHRDRKHNCVHTARHYCFLHLGVPGTSTPTAVRAHRCCSSGTPALQSCYACPARPDPRAAGVFARLAQFPFSAFFNRVSHSSPSPCFSSLTSRLGLHRHRCGGRPQPARGCHHLHRWLGQLPWSFRQLPVLEAGGSYPRRRGPPGA